MPILTLLTDFGLADYYVAAVKGTVLRLAPGTQPIDLSHAVAPGDVEGAAFLLAAAASAFPAGTVHLCVVDPGVGSDRRLLAVGQGGRFFVAPDNGLLTPVLEGAAVHAVTRTGLFLDAPSATFHGRDRMAPIAAHLLRGEPLGELGPAISDPVRLERRTPRRDGEALVGQVVHIDHFGNLVTDIPSAWLGEQSFEARVGSHRIRLTASHYAALPAGRPAVVPGSAGTLELSLNGESLAERWQTPRGAAVRVILRAGA